MNPKDRALLKQAIARNEQIALYYNKPGVGPIQRHVRPYELSVNRAGREVVWGTDSVHGARQIHAFRTDRILTVVASQRPKEFRPAVTIGRHLVSYGKLISNE